MISFLVGSTDTLITRPGRRFSISARIWGLPVTNIRAPRDCSRISFRESKSRSRWAAVHSSSASIIINVCRDDVMSCSIFTISVSRCLRPLTTLFCSCKAHNISSGILSIPLITWLSTEPSILVADCSFRAAKSK